MKLQAYITTTLLLFSIISFSFSNDSSSSQTITSALLIELGNFYKKKDRDKAAQKIESTLQRFTIFYEVLLEFNNIQNFHPFYKLNAKIWNPEFEYNPFGKHKSLRKIKADSQIQQYVQALEEYRDELIKNFLTIWPDQVSVNVFGRKEQKFTDTEKITFLRNMERIRNIKKGEFYMLNEIIALFKISTTEQTINFIDNNKKTIGIGAVTTLILSLIGFGCYEVNSFINSIADDFKDGITG